MNASADTSTRTIPSADSHCETSGRYPRHCPGKFCRYEAFADGTAAREAVLNELLGISAPGVRQVYPRPKSKDMSQSFADGSAQRRVAMERALREGKR